jgi:hypothetical protein
MSTEEQYANARIALNSAMEDYIKAAQAIGVDSAGIASDACDAMFDVSNGEIKLTPEL